MPKFLLRRPLVGVEHKTDGKSFEWLEPGWIVDAPRMDRPDIKLVEVIYQERTFSVFSGDLRKRGARIESASNST